MKYIAFLRGINVHGRSIKMTILKSCFETLGLRGVKTFLQTGNVEFESGQSSPTIKSNIEVALTKTFNYPAKVQVYEIETLRKLVIANPFSSQNDDFHQYVLFFENGLENELFAEAQELDKSLEKIELGDGVIYWTVLKGSTLSSQIAKYLTKPKYKNYNTSRNLNTLRKIIT